jgi:hypothetical protein
MKRILALLLGIHCAACTIGSRERPWLFSSIQSPSTSSTANPRDARAGNAAEANCIVKGQQSAG